jgi:hypothetical protein
MWPAILITLGVLFLFDQLMLSYRMDFFRTCPALLIVIGLVLFLKHSAPTNGHVPREFVGVQPAPGPYVQTPVAPAPVAPGPWVPPPPPVEPGGKLPGEHPDDTGVHNG